MFPSKRKKTVKIDSTEQIDVYDFVCLDTMYLEEFTIPALDSGMEAEEEKEIHLKNIIQQKKGDIPTPCITEITNYITDSYVISNKYYKYHSDVHNPYIMSDIDYNIINKYNIQEQVYYDIVQGIKKEVDDIKRSHLMVESNIVVESTSGVIQVNDIGSKHSVVDSKHSIVDSKHSVVDSKHSVVDSKHSVVDSKHSIVDSKHSVVDSKHSIVDNVKMVSTIEDKSVKDSISDKYNTTVQAHISNDTNDNTVQSHTSNNVHTNYTVQTNDTVQTNTSNTTQSHTNDTVHTYTNNNTIIKQVDTKILQEIKTSIKYKMLLREEDSASAYVCFRKRILKPSRKNRRSEVQTTEKIIKINQEVSLINKMSVLMKHSSCIDTEIDNLNMEICKVVQDILQINTKYKKDIKTILNNKKELKSGIVQTDVFHNALFNRDKIRILRKRLKEPFHFDQREIQKEMSAYKNMYKGTKNEKWKT